jgi:hypothetical protein
MAAPTTTLRFRRRRWNQPIRGDVASAAGRVDTPATTFPTVASVVVTLVVPDAGIDERVDHVDDEVDEDV